MIRIKMIACMNNNCAIGYENKLLWHDKNDLKFFKRMTQGNAILMGYKTAKSLPVYPLPKRFNITLTSNPKASDEVSNINDAINLAKDYETMWIIGGQSLYEQFMDITEEVYLTSILDDQIGDKFFPYEMMIERFKNKEILEEHGNTFMIRYFL